MLNIEVTQNGKIVNVFHGVTEIRREYVYIDTKDGELEFDCIIVTNAGVDHYFVAGPDASGYADDVMHNSCLNVSIDRSKLSHFRTYVDMADWAAPRPDGFSHGITFLPCQSSLPSLQEETKRKSKSRS